MINFNDDWKIANWVAYHLCADYFETEVLRVNYWRKDMTLPEELQVEYDDYQDSLTTGIHYDRGHLAPSKAFLLTEEAMKTTHMYSNGIPQTKELNRTT